MALASSQMTLDSCQKGLRKMKFHLPGNCSIFITVSAAPLRRQGQRSPHHHPRRLRWSGEGQNLISSVGTATHIPITPTAGPQSLGHAGH